MSHASSTPIAVLVIRLWLEGEEQSLRGRVVADVDGSERSVHAVLSAEQVCALVREAVDRLQRAAGSQ